MKRLFTLSIVMAALTASLVSAADWPMFGRDASNAAATEDFAPTDLPNAYVTTSPYLGVKNASAPVAADGRVYVYSNGATGALYCLDGNSLTTLWSAPVMVNDTGYGSWATPALGSSSIVFAADAFLGCWNPDGTERWSVVLSNQVGNGSCAIVGNRVIVPCFSWVNSEFGVSAFDVQTGSNLWNIADASLSFSACTPVIDEASGKGYACAATNVWQFDLATGAIGWNVNPPDATGLQNVSMSAGTLFVVDFAFGSSSLGSNLYALSTVDGSLEWIGQVNVSDVPPAIWSNAVVHSAGDEWGVPRELTALDINTGTQLWKVAGLGCWNLMPAIGKGVVYASDNNTTNLSCVNVADGSVLSSVIEGGCSPAIADETLYTAFNGVVYAYFVPEPAGIFAMLLFAAALLRGKRKLAA